MNKMPRYKIIKDEDPTFPWLFVYDSEGVYATVAIVAISLSNHQELAEQICDFLNKQKTKLKRKRYFVINRNQYNSRYFIHDFLLIVCD